MEKGMYEPRFPLSGHFMRTHFSGGENFDKDNASGCFPDVLRKIYSFDGNFTGKGIKIAVISAFDNAALENDLNVFSERFGLEKPKVSVYFGKDNGTSGAWLTESCLDTQWAHVFAPSAEIFVVFSQSSDAGALLSAAEYASGMLGADIVCMCFGTEESLNDRELSAFFENSRCIFVSSSGDVGGLVSFPSTSPYCVSVGGTKLLCGQSGKRIEETAWANGGGGKSSIFEIPPYQARFFNIYGMADGMRGTPDVSMMANYVPGVPVYVSQLGGWTTVGGTSLACACFLGICACIKQKYPKIVTSEDMLSFLYGKAGGDGYSALQYNFYDVTIGKSGENFAEKGWDFCTGLGSPVIRQLLL